MKKVAPPVWPNVGVETWYRKRLQAEIRRMAQDMYTSMRRAWNDSAPAFDIALAYDAPGRVTQLKKALAKWGSTWIGRLDKLSVTLAAQFANRSFHATQTSMKDSFRKAGFTVRFQPTRGSIEAYRAVHAENVNLIKSIPEKYLTDVQSAVWTSVMQGGNLSDLSLVIQKKYGLAFKRAALIARDQNNKAKAVIENVRRMELGIVEAIWLHSAASKVPRPSHIHVMNGQRYKLKDGMYDPDEGRFVFPGELINCRCVSKSVVPFEGFD